MFRRFHITLALALILGLAAVQAASAQSCPSIGDLINQAPVQDVSQEEQTGLVFMREEEKLARDVYLALSDQWGLRVFDNIAQAEQTHMDTILLLLDKYGVADPAADDVRGRFSNPDLQSLYAVLIEAGSASAQAALEVGATIEDLDLSDLDRQLVTTDNTDVKIAYQNLAKGSRNHLRAFVGNLEMLGATYQARYIDQATLEQILAEPNERGVYDENGDPLCTPGGGQGNGPGQGGPGQGGPGQGGPNR